jgi:hypothetical protein
MRCISLLQACPMAILMPDFFISYKNVTNRVLFVKMLASWLQLLDTLKMNTFAASLTSNHHPTTASWRGKGGQTSNLNESWVYFPS